MIKTIAIGVVILVVAVLGYAATKPDTFRVERSTTVDASPEKIFPLINDLHSFGTWSPYEKRDPAMKRTFSGPESGKGATYAWEGNSDIGKGSMQIIDATAPDKVLMQLDFIEPFEAHNIVEFTLVPAGDSTRVSWAMHGPSTFVAKLIGVFVSMDDMVGTDFETGLASLKAAAEK